MESWNLMLDVNSQNGSPYWKKLLFFVFLMFALIVMRVWVVEIAIDNGFVNTLQQIQTNQMTWEDNDLATVTTGQDRVMFFTKRLLEALIGIAILYIFIVPFKKERQMV